MEINYTIVAIVAFVVILLIVFLVRRNRKDQKDYERDKIQSDIPPEQHDEDHV